MYLEENRRWVPSFCAFSIAVCLHALLALLHYKRINIYVVLNIIRVTEPSVRWVKKMFTKKFNLPYDLSSYHHWNKSGI